MTGRKTGKFGEMASIIDLRLGDVLGQLGSALDEAAERLSEGEGGEIRRERQFDTGKGPVRASVGLRIRTLGGESVTDRRPERPINQASRTENRTGPALRMVEATVFDEAHMFSVVADVPGIQAEEVSWDVKGSLLRIDAKSAQRHYRVETELPDAWQNAEFECVVENGILELSAEQEKP